MLRRALAFGGLSRSCLNALLPLPSFSSPSLCRSAASVVRWRSASRALLSSSSLSATLSSTQARAIRDDDADGDDESSIMSDQLSSSPPPILPLHILGAGSLGMVVAACLRLAFPSYPVKLLIRDRARQELHEKFDDPAINSSSGDDIRAPGMRRRRKAASMTISYQRADVSAATPTASSSSARLTPPRLVEVPVEAIQSSEDEGGGGGIDDHRNKRRAPAIIRNLLVTTKAYDAHAALASIRLRIDPRITRVVLLGNGALSVRNQLMDSDDWYTTGIENKSDCDGSGEGGDGTVETAVSSRQRPRVALAWTSHGAYQPTRDEEGKKMPPRHPQGLVADDDDERHRFRGVVHAGTLGKTAVEDWPELAKVLTTAGLNCQSFESDEIRRQLWLKLAANCCINPLTALHDCRNGELLDMMMTYNATGINDPGPSASRAGYATIEEQVQAVVDEVVAVARAEDGIVDLSTQDALAFVRQVMVDTKANYSSMVQDVRNHKRTEVNELNGYVVRVGRKRNIACPANEVLWKQIAELDRKIVDPVRVDPTITQAARRKTHTSRSE